MSTGYQKSESRSLISGHDVHMSQRTLKKTPGRALFTDAAVRDPVVQEGD
jgi:hypothetical protein